MYELVLCLGLMAGRCQYAVQATYPTEQDCYRALERSTYSQFRKHNVELALCRPKGASVTFPHR